MSDNNELDPNTIRERQKHPIRQVAVLGIINQHGLILMVRTVRLPNHWQPLGGGMDPEDTTPVDTILRELREETNLLVLASKVTHEITTDYDFGTGKVHFYSTEMNEPNEMWFNPAEIVEHRWFALEESLALESFPATKKFLAYLLSKSRNVK